MLTALAFLLGLAGLALPVYATGVVFITVLSVAAALVKGGFSWQGMAVGVVFGVLAYYNMKGRKEKKAAPARKAREESAPAAELSIVQEEEYPQVKYFGSTRT